MSTEDKADVKMRRKMGKVHKEIISAYKRGADGSSGGMDYNTINLLRGKLKVLVDEYWPEGADFFKSPETSTQGNIFYIHRCQRVAPVGRLIVMTYPKIVVYQQPYCCGVTTISAHSSEGLNCPDLDMYLRFISLYIILESLAVQRLGVIITAVAQTPQLIRLAKKLGLRKTHSFLSHKTGRTIYTYQGVLVPTPKLKKKGATNA